MDLYIYNRLPFIKLVSCFSVFWRYLMLRNIETRLTQLQDRTEVTPYHADASCLQQQFSTPLANIIPNIFGTQTHSDDIKLSRDFGSVRFFEKIQHWVLKSENGFCVSLLNRLIQGRVRLGSIRNKNNWNNASKRLFGSYSHSEIPGFHSGYSAPRSRIAGIYSGNTFSFRNIPKRTRPKITQIMVHHRNWKPMYSAQGFFGSFDAQWSEWSWINLFSNETQNPLLNLRYLILDWPKETRPRHPRKNLLIRRFPER